MRYGATGDKCINFYFVLFVTLISFATCPSVIRLQKPQVHIQHDSQYFIFSFFIQIHLYSSFFTTNWLHNSILHVLIIIPTVYLVNCEFKDVTYLLNFNENFVD